MADNNARTTCCFGYPECSNESLDLDQFYCDEEIDDNFCQFKACRRAPLKDSGMPWCEFHMGTGFLKMRASMTEMYNRCQELEIQNRREDRRTEVERLRKDNKELEIQVKRLQEVNKVLNDQLMRTNQQPKKTATIDVDKYLMLEAENDENKMIIGRLQKTNDLLEKERDAANEIVQRVLENRKELREKHKRRREQYREQRRQDVDRIAYLEEQLKTANGVVEKARGLDDEEIEAVISKPPKKRLFVSTSGPRKRQRVPDTEDEAEEADESEETDTDDEMTTDSARMRTTVAAQLGANYRSG